MLENSIAFKFKLVQVFNVSMYTTPCDQIVWTTIQCFDICIQVLVQLFNVSIYTTLFLCSFIKQSQNAGKRYFTLKQAGEVGGSYNVFLQTSLPPHLRFYDPDEETYDSSQTAFKQVFPRGFALEVVQVFSGPPLIAYKYRHWGYMEGSYKEYPATGELIEMFGIAVFEVLSSILSLISVMLCISVLRSNKCCWKRIIF